MDIWNGYFNRREQEILSNPPKWSNTSYECELETLGQYTGFKDKNRKGSKFCRL